MSRGNSLSRGLRRASSLNEGSEDEMAYLHKLEKENGRPLTDSDNCVCPASVLETDWLDFLYLIVNIKSSVLCNLFSFFD